jgi:3',5'-cyclic AMP phosphodiesterase CpdA
LTFKLAHFSDVHLGPVAWSESVRNFQIKRLIGIVSWKVNRSGYCKPEIAQALRESILSLKPDHIICGGDLVNISAWSEFPRARDYLTGFGAADGLSLAPGNHDTYVHVPAEQGLDHFAPWFANDLRPASDATQLPFPTVRLRRNIALITLNSASPQGLRYARGALGDAQLNAVRGLLLDLRARGFCRVISIHHPPLPGLALDRKALIDAAQFQQVLEETGAELIVHGHNHRTMKHVLETPVGPVPVIGVAAASSTGTGKHEVASWHMFSIDRRNREWRMTMTPYRFDPASFSFIPGKDFVLPSGAAVRQNGIE